MSILASPGAAQSTVQIDTDAKFIFSDNPFLLSGSDRSAAAVEISASPEVIWSLSPATSLEAAATFSHRQYLRSYGGFFNGRGHLLASHRDSEFLSGDIRLAYARDLAADALTESIDFSIDSMSVRENYSARASLVWNPNSRTSVTAATGWETLDYPGSDLLVSTRALSADLGFARRLSEVTSLGAQVSTTITDGGGRDTISVQSIRATAAHRLSNSWQANAQLGVEWTGGGMTGDSHRARLSGNGNLCYRPGRIEACLSTSLQSEVSGFGGLQRELFLGATLRRQLTEHSSVAASSELRAAELGTFGPETGAFQISGSYEQRLSRRFLVSSRLNYLRRKFLTGERNHAMVALVGITFRGGRR